MPLSRKTFLRAVLLLLLSLVVAALVVPYSVIEHLLERFAWINRTMDFIDTVAPGLEMSHLIAFGALGFIACFAWPRARRRNVALGVLVVAVAVETIQIWVPGREAAVSHAVLETLGGWAGFFLATLLTYAWGPESLPDFKHSTHWRGDNTHP